MIFAALLAALAAVVPAQISAQERVEFEIGYMPILPVSQLFIGLEEGWIDEAGITPDLVQFQNGPAMVQALLAGQLDVAYFGIGPAMVARARGADIKVVSSNIVEQISVVALGELAPYFDGDHATAFDRFAADKGRRAVITTFPTGSVPETVLQFWLRRQLGADVDQVEIIFQGAAQVQQALLTGAVDGAAILEPIVSIVTSRLDDAVVVAAGSELFPGQPGAVLAVRSEAIAAYPDQVRALVAAHKRATDLLVNDAEAATPAVAKYVGGGRLDPKIIRTAIEGSAAGFVSDPNFIIEGTRVMHDFQAEIGTLKKPVDLDALFDVSIYDSLSGG
ncbi:ABC transporter substrate-binding protein [Roseobacter ponti]|uniref:ABC transporter substrate-binding protein n=1 Tax=Roseobacter ponti TaxID=1891787 RepID=A0A858T0I0_9RHOB|nr:ABC transporter substrate-binding protein [Roseobacter ponti]QJF53261.1 ABC transporter substrate-binding protein [Roseobacter ponti]